MIHRLNPRARLDNALVFRDPNPAKADQPHPNYRSDTDSSVADGVKIVAVSIAEYRRSELRSFARKERGKTPKNQRFNLDDTEIDKALTKIEDAVKYEIERTINREKRGFPPYYVRRISPREVQSHETALVGQYGLFVRDSIKEKDRPTLTNGNIIGLFAGAPLSSAKQHKYHIDALKNKNDFEHYSVDINKSLEAPAITVSPMNGGNSMALANTAILAETVNTKQPKYDEDKIDAIFVACDVKMIDKFGKERSEQVAVVVGLDNLRGQVYLNYGDRYLEHFALGSNPSRFSDRIAGKIRKRSDNNVVSHVTPSVTVKKRKLDPRSRSEWRAR